MRNRVLWLCAVVAAFAFGAVSSPRVWAQSSTAGLVTGMVEDPSKAPVAGATVTLKRLGTNVVLTVSTRASGLYTFPNVPPASYTLTVTATGFEKTVLSSVVVDVLKSYTVNVELKLGTQTTTVEVAGGVSELETASSTVGEVLEGSELENLPVYTRSASALMFLQPAVSPPDVMYQSGSPSDNIGGQVAGSRSEQITFSLDGGDVTSDLEGTNNYNAPPHEPQPAPIVPIPQEMTQEFRVGVSNPNATFDRSSGGQVATMTKSGTNAWHGEGYQYNNNDGFNANSWTNNLGGISKPHEVDNRFGGNLGGPIYKNKVWFFAGYEGRRFYENATGSRIVPSPSLAAGILTFPDATGAEHQYNLKTATDCGPAGTSACDPRGIGISPTIAAQLKLYPAPTPGPGGATCGDGVNTACYLFSAPTPFLEDIGVLRLDDSINSKWSAFFTYHTADSRRVGTEQAQISVTAPASYVSTDPFYPSFYSFQIAGQLTPDLTAVSHGSFLRNWWGWGRDNPGTYGVPGTTQVLELTGEGVGASNSAGKFLADPVNVNTQQARSRTWDGRDVYVAEDFSYTRGVHLFQFGASFYRWNDVHVRSDDVIGGLTNFPIAYIETAGNGNGEYASVGAAYQPPTCTGSNSTNCLPSGLATNWDELYAAVTGMVDRSAQIATYSGTFQPNPLGSYLTDDVTMYAPYGYFQDVWKVRSTITLTMGVDWGAQLNPSEANNKEALLTSATTGAAINFQQYLSAREKILGAGIMPGQPFNPQFALTPVADVPAPLTGLFKQNVFHDFGPRFSVAWNVPSHNRLFGHNNSTVIRAGYSLLYDRSSAVGEVLNPLLAGGLANVDACGGPLSSSGPTNTPMCSFGTTTPLNAYRIGVDGATVPIPAPQPEPIPYVIPTSPSQFLTAALNPYATPAHAHNVNFDVQRSLPGGMVMELGYIGKFSRNLPQGQSLNDPYYLTKDAISGQTLAQAFAAVATAVQRGQAIPAEPWFENQLGGPAKCQGAASTLGLAGVTNCSTLVAAADPFDFSVEGLGNWAFSQGGTGLNSLLPLVGFPQMDNQQIFLFNTTSDGAYSNYNALITTLSKNVSANLQFQFNWTWSRALGTQGLNQQYLYASNSPYNLGLDYGPEVFDHTHVINGLFVYNLPFGKGQAHSSGNEFADRVIGGWTVSGIATYFTGLPLAVDCDGDFGSAYFLLGSGVACNSSLGLAGLTATHQNIAAATSSNANDGLLSGQTVGGAGDWNIFANPAAVLSSVRPANIATTSQISWGQLRMIPSWNFDFGLIKNIPVTERLNVQLRGDFLNLFNHVLFATPSLDTVFAGPTFGQFTSQANAPRNLLVGARITF
jgi:Carboxypeptidase regulatory-like domain